MSAPASEELRELERLLVLAAEQGESRTFESLGQELGSPPKKQLDEMLNTLREHGKAVEEAPGLWSGPPLDMGVTDPEPRVVVSVEEPVDDQAAIEAAPAEAIFGYSEPPTVVRLTRSIVDALDEQTLGAIVRAGVHESDHGGFVLEVPPS